MDLFKDIDFLKSRGLARSLLFSSSSLIFYIFCGCGAWTASHLFHYMDGTPFVSYSLRSVRYTQGLLAQDVSQTIGLLPAAIKNSLSAFFNCCGTWARTKIPPSRGACPTIRRSRNNLYLTKNTLKHFIF